MEPCLFITIFYTKVLKSSPSPGMSVLCSPLAALSFHLGRKCNSVLQSMTPPPPSAALPRTFPNFPEQLCVTFDCRGDNIYAIQRVDILTDTETVAALFGSSEPSLSLFLPFNFVFCLLAKCKRSAQPGPCRHDVCASQPRLSGEAGVLAALTSLLTLFLLQINLSSPAAGEKLPPGE